MAAGAVSDKPATTLRLVREVKRTVAIATFLVGRRLGQVRRSPVFKIDHFVWRYF
jgi:hypothetical protein